MARPKRVGPPVKARDTRRRIQIEVSDEKRLALDSLASKMNCKAPDLMLRALDAYLDQNSGTIPLVQQMSGSPEVLAQKNLALRAYRKMAGQAGAARDAKVTLATIRYWIKTDEIFAQLAEEATQYCVDQVRNRMFLEAMKPGPASFRDRIAILNAKDADFGIIRPQMLVKILGPFLDRVIECASILTEDPEKLQHFAVELGEYADGVVSSQSAGRRR